MPCNYAEIMHSGWFEVPSSIGVLNFSIATYTKVCLWPRSRATFSVGNMSVNSSWTWDIDSQAGNVIKNEMFQPLDIQTNASYDFQSGEGWFSLAFSRCNLHVRFTEPFSRVLLLVLCLKTNLNIGREPWSSGYVPKVGSSNPGTVYWMDFFTFICCKNWKVCLKGRK